MKNGKSKKGAVPVTPIHGKARARQVKFAGEEFAGKQDRELNLLAEDYLEKMRKRIAKGKLEKAAKDALIKAMREKKVTIYRDEDAVPPLLVRLKPGADGVKIDIEGDEVPEEASPKGAVGDSGADAGDRA